MSIRSLSDAESVIKSSRLSLHAAPPAPKNVPAEVNADGPLPSTSCLSYRFIFLEGQSPYTSYLFALHTIRTLPWIIVLVEHSMFLHSDSCTEEAIITDDVRHPCISCHALHNHVVIMGI
jgi:hypothetical protein